MKSTAEELEFNEKGDERGHLVVIEGKKDVPFDIKRLFYIYGADSKTIRGEHANRKSEFVLINVSGTSRVKVDNGMGNIVTYNLDKPNVGVFIPKMVWKEMFDFSKDSVLLVLSNELYDADEYIRDYDTFLREVRKQRGME